MASYQGGSTWNWEKKREGAHKVGEPRLAHLRFGCTHLGPKQWQGNPSLVAHQCFVKNFDTWILFHPYFNFDMNFYYSYLGEKGRPRF